MATLGDLKARIADELMKRNLTTQIAQHIARAVEHYSTHRFWFNVGSLTGSPISADADGYVPLPTGTRVIDKIRIGQIWLEKRDMEVIEDWLANSPATAVEPYDYAPAGERVRLYPTPSGPVTLVATGVIDVTPKITATAADSVDNAWTNDGADLIAARARMTLYRDVLRDPGGVALAKDAIREAEQDLGMKTMRRIGAGRVEACL
ncbi:MAG: hypothetical protein JNK30_21960 [Phenylobacterium sp.]|uniref:phage adaptor protein n=1 Tax=Phenylobacterium sp. TaxID=1871053 RepID=UPI001A379EA0|nr:hypothetical protein [Phenylobacterium sp.]MBL8774068.1 hypothetical protein [Phenylobacterium sp.]